MKQPPKQPRARRHYLREWREHLGITQERAMERLEWSQSKISRVESGVSPLTLDDLHAAADAYGRTVFELQNVHPGKEREVIDITDLLVKATPEQRKQVADFATYLIRRN